MDDGGLSILMCIPRSQGGLGPDPDPNTPPPTIAEIQAIGIAVGIFGACMVVFAVAILWITFAGPI